MRYAVVGGGIIGLSIAIALLERRLGIVTIFEKESSLGAHASTRNSGVIHSGIYYSADSLKARFSVVGNEEIKRLCRDNNLQLLETGKLILSQNKESEAQLGALEARGQANGVPLSRLGKNELSKFAPGAKTHESFIWVESTAVANPKEVFSALQMRYFALGGKTETYSEVSTWEETGASKLKINGVEFDYLFNAAGSGAVKLAQKFEIGSEYLVTPFLGIYWGIETRSLPIKMPLYPTPHPINPFLGVHLTPTPYGYTKIGPTAIPVIGKEQYSWHEGFSLKDAFESLAAYTRIGLGRSHSLTQIIKSELPKFFLKKMAREASQLLPQVQSVDGWKPIPSGIRAQLVDKEGMLVQDFVIERTHNTTHILNAVSPGWTSAIPFGKWIVEGHLRVSNT
jgi:L-2-hydroxyglutarate oxidase LhgO